jgi:hypothetical protein
MGLFIKIIIAGGESGEISRAYINACQEKQHISSQIVRIDRL